MILQAQEYEEQQKINLQEFFDSTNGKFKSPIAQAWAEEIIRRRGCSNGDMLP
jgi:putative hydrolases of HD superfamily